MTGTIPPNIQTEAEAILIPRTPGLLTTQTPPPDTSATTTLLSSPIAPTTPVLSLLIPTSVSHTLNAVSHILSQTPVVSDESDDKDLSVLQMPLTKRGPPGPTQKTPVR